MVSSIFLLLSRDKRCLRLSRGLEWFAFTFLRVAANGKGEFLNLKKKKTCEPRPRFSAYVTLEGLTELVK